MYVIVVSPRQKAQPKTYPAVVLTTDNWDDYGFRNTFFCEVQQSANLPLVDIGGVKITRLGKDDNGLAAGNDFQGGLPSEYASLGTSIEYYENLEALGTVQRDDILKSLGDVTLDDERLTQFQHDRGFRKSLLRASPARQALEHYRPDVRTAPSSDGGAHIYLPEKPANIVVPLPSISIGAVVGSPSVSAPQSALEVGDEGVQLVTDEKTHPEDIPPTSFEQETPGLSLVYTPPGSSRLKRKDPINFDFSGRDHLPRRVIVLVGPNGTGKTTLLAKLAEIAFEGSDAEGGLLAATPAVGKILFVSYSALDTFKLPDEKASADEWAENGYIYIGLRHPKSDTKSKDPISLKSPEEQRDDFVKALDALKETSNEIRQKAFQKAMAHLLGDPSIAQALGIEPGRKSEIKVEALFKVLRDGFDPLSTGHKAILNIVASLCARLARGSLLLMDEPEAHLHPPLIAVLLSTVRELLESFDSHAIVATHSPVIVQETLKRHVKIMNWEGSVVAIGPPDFETFGESLATITRKTFGLVAADADYTSTLRGMAHADMSLDEIRQLFPDGMSGSARSLLLQEVARARAEGRKAKRAERRKAKNAAQKDPT